MPSSGAAWRYLAPRSRGGITLVAARARFQAPMLKTLRLYARPFSSTKSSRKVLGSPSGFRLRAVPLAGSRGAVRLTVAPWGPVLALHAALSESMAPLGLAPRKPTALFRPHLSLAYNNRPRPAAPVIEAVTPLRGLAPVDLHVREVQLVEPRREDRACRWDVVKSLPLG